MKRRRGGDLSCGAISGMLNMKMPKERGEKMNFESNPQYQRLVQKMMRYSPHQQAVLSTALADKEFANQDTKKMFTLAQMGAQKEYRRKALAFKEESRRQSLAFKEKSRSQSIGLYNQKTDLANSQVNKANIINTLGVGLSAKTAYDTNKVAGLKAKRIMDIAEGYRGDVKKNSNSEIDWTPKVRTKLYPNEDAFFKAHPKVTGRAAEDNMVTLNPYSTMTGQERQSVIKNESTRIHMRTSGTKPSFAITPEQRKYFSTLNDGKAYGSDQDIRETIVARIVSGDSSAGKVTPEQIAFAKKLQQNWGLRADGTPKGPGFLGTLKRPDGRVSTELSIGVDFGKGEVEIPSLVPTLTTQEVDYLLKGGKPTRMIIDKAVSHAKKRKASGLSLFAD